MIVLNIKYNNKVDLGYPADPIVNKTKIKDNPEDVITELIIAYRSNRLVYLHMRE